MFPPGTYWLQRFNRDIADPNCELGISFFMREDLPDWIEDVWRCEIEPYLVEYFFDQREIAAKYAWSRLSTDRLKAWATSG
ncbi:MAG TPA: hypothetical protein VHN14_06610 [Kofleriaceae bacterium]|nr:hypothetical protein [Kofleriaceae bacterium]